MSMLRPDIPSLTPTELRQIGELVEVEQDQGRLGKSSGTDSVNTSTSQCGVCEYLINRLLKLSYERFSQVLPGDIPKNLL